MACAWQWRRAEQPLGGAWSFRLEACFCRGHTCPFSGGFAHLWHLPPPSSHCAAAKQFLQDIRQGGAAAEVAVAAYTEADCRPQAMRAYSVSQQPCLAVRLQLQSGAVCMLAQDGEASASILTRAVVARNISVAWPRLALQLAISVENSGDPSDLPDVTRCASACTPNDA